MQVKVQGQNYDLPFWGWFLIQSLYVGFSLFTVAVPLLIAWGWSTVTGDDLTYTIAIFLAAWIFWGSYNYIQNKR